MYMLKVCHKLLPSRPVSLYICTRSQSQSPLEHTVPIDEDYTLHSIQGTIIHKITPIVRYQI